MSGFQRFPSGKQTNPRLVFIVEHIGNEDEGTTTAGRCVQCGSYVDANHFGNHVANYHVERRADLRG